MVVSSYTAPPRAWVWGCRAAACGVEGRSWGVRAACTQGYLPLPACRGELVPAPLPGRSASLGLDTRSFAALTARPGPQDLIVHVRDVSHPEAELQKRSVLSTLHSLQLPAPLLDSMVEVHNKVDLVPG